jgi:hypothetical protein
MQNKFSVQLQKTGHRTGGNHGPGSGPSKLSTLATKKSRCWPNQAITFTENLARFKFCWRTSQIEVRQSTLGQLQGRQVRKHFVHEYGEICEQNFYVYLHLLFPLTVVKYGKCCLFNGPWPMTTSDLTGGAWDPRPDFERPANHSLARLAGIGGGPAIVGAWVAGLVYSQPLSVLFLAIV